MTEEEVVHLQLDLARCEGTLMGHVGRCGAPLQPFIGWIALNAAIEELLDTIPSQVADDPRPGAGCE